MSAREPELSTRRRSVRLPVSALVVMVMGFVAGGDASTPASAGESGHGVATIVTNAEVRFGGATADATWHLTAPSTYLSANLCRAYGDFGEFSVSPGKETLDELLADDPFAPGHCAVDVAGTAENNDGLAHQATAWCSDHGSSVPVAPGELRDSVRVVDEDRVSHELGLTLEWSSAGVGVFRSNGVVPVSGTLETATGERTVQGVLVLRISEPWCIAYSPVHVVLTVSPA